MKSTLPSPRLAAGQLISARDILLRRDCMSRLNEWLEAKGYCTRGVTIIELSNLIGTNRTTLSQFINQEYQLSFRDWINRYRCDEAIRQWEDMPTSRWIRWLRNAVFRVGNILIWYSLLAKA